MADRIQILDDNTANQIAAGEVVERPASVLKELVENSLDAGARRIAARLEEGGGRLVRVVDDGCGMSPRDAELSLRRHATSKLRDAGDLHAIHTLGFRGEALPSIASVSRLELVTRLPGSDLATRVTVEGGRLVGVGETAAPPGTRITAGDLFYNTPARLKFLRSAKSELGQAVEAFARLALASPGCALRLENETQILLATPGSGRAIDAVAAVLGQEAARRMVPFEGTWGGLRVWGFAGLPEQSRAGRAQQYYFVNRRPVRSQALRYPLEEAYRGLLTVGRYPVAVVYVELDPAAVDVNVHPTKLEVRFSREQEVRAAVYRALREALGGRRLVPGLGPAKADAGAEVREGGASGGASDETSGGARWSPLATAETAATYPRQWIAGADPAGPGDFLTGLRPLGQFRGTYLVCEGEEGLYLIDQHAAHERINLEELEDQAEAAGIAAQYLALPVDLDLSAEEWFRWEEYQEEIRKVGIDARPFGGRTLVVQALPAPLAATAGEARALLRDFFDRLREGERGGDPLRRRRQVLEALAACHASVRAGDRLDPAEVSQLLRRLARARNPFSCPHGRPTVVCLSQGEVDRRFKRG